MPMKMPGLSKGKVSRSTSPFGDPVPVGVPTGSIVPQTSMGGLPPAIGESTAFWTQAFSQLVYGAPNPDLGNVAGISGQAIWQTPLFDLRSDFRARSGYSGETQAIGRDVLLGIDYALHVQLQGGAALINQANPIRFFYMEFMAAENPNTARFSMDPVDITLQISQGYTITVAGQNPPGQVWLEFVPEGKPRYWGAVLIVNNYSGANIPFTVAGALH
jgi:hypothetical protein